MQPSMVTPTERRGRKRSLEEILPTCHTQGRNIQREKAKLLLYVIQWMTTVTTQIKCGHAMTRPLNTREDGKIIEAIRSGSVLRQRDASYASLPTSVGSSGGGYYTPLSYLPGKNRREKASPDTGKKVILPPGVPYPAKQTLAQPGAAAVDAPPCLGCGKIGYW